MMNSYDESPIMRGMYPSRQAWRAAVRRDWKQRASDQKKTDRREAFDDLKARQRACQKAKDIADAARPRYAKVKRDVPLVNVIGRGGNRIMRQLIGDKLYRMG